MKNYEIFRKTTKMYRFDEKTLKTLKYDEINKFHQFSSKYGNILQFPQKM